MRQADYVAETTTSIAGTLGNGAVTLTAITSRPRFSTVFGTQKTNVDYEIEDTVSFKYERGVGSVTSNVLTRTEPRQTWDGTTWSAKNAATPLQFGATPTSGNVVIRMAATSDAMAPVIPARQNTVTGDANWRDYALSPTVNDSNGGGGVAMTLGRQYYTLYKLENAGLLTGVQLEVTASSVASHIAVGLYDIDSTGLPGALLTTFNVFDSSTTGIKADTTVGTWTPAGGIWLNPGWYAIGFLTDVTPSIRCAPGQTGYKGFRTPFGRFDAYGESFTVYVTQAYVSGLQATYSGSGTLLSNGGGNNFNGPWIGLKVVA